jgi:hypothetical protein
VPLERIADLTQYPCAELGFGKVLALPIVGHAVVGGIARSSDDLLAHLLPLVRNPGRKVRFEIEQSLLVLLSVHAGSQQ